MLEAIAGFYAAALVVPVVVLGFAVAYVSLRIRDSRSETPDPELGIKSAYHAFMTTGILLILTGLTISATDFLQEAFDDKQKNQQPQFGGPGQFGPQPKFGPQPQFRPQQPIDDDPFDRMSQRVAWPLVISGVLFSLMSLLLIVAGTNDKHFPAVKRTFGGLRLLVEGLCVMAGMTIAIELLFQKNMADLRPFSIAVALICIWLPAAAIQVFLLKTYGKLPYYVPPQMKKGTRREPDLDDDDVVKGELEEPERRRPPRLPREEEKE
jgi:hypothetical protein